MTPEEVLAFIKQNNIQIVDLKFNDLPGLWQHFSMPAGELTDADNPTRGIWVDGIGFDGSSIRGFKQIQESDMLLVPDAQTAVIDPICQIPTLSIICDIYDPLTKQPFTRDPRYIAKKAEKYLKSTGIADVSYWGPEMEFFIFDDIRYEQNQRCGFYFVDSAEADWNTGKEENPNLGYKPRYKEGYFPTPPHDTFQDIRSEIVLTMIKSGIPIEVHHHEVATAGQGEIDMKFDSLARMGDKMMLYKYIVKNIARKHNKVATFMPKPIFEDNGSGMHVHQSLFKGGEHVCLDPNGYALISQTAKYHIGGLLKHSASLLALAAPTTNSYRRLVPGFEAPVNLVYSARNRSACVRIPVYTDNPRAKRIEYRPPDNSCNGYMALAAMLMAGLDGIKNQIDPGEPLDKDSYHLAPEEAAKIQTVPSSLGEALDALEQDHDYLLKGDVFTADVIETWLEYKRSKELDALRLRPHPYEFYLYSDI
jgi:glutamine synthetase